MTNGNTAENDTAGAVNLITCTINNVEARVPEGSTILEAAKTVGVHIPTLCHLDLHDLKMVNQVGTCRVCMVEAEGRWNLLPSCSTAVTQNMVIHTNTPRAVRSRRIMVELFLSNHPKECLICERNQNCELQSLAAELGVREIRYTGPRFKTHKDSSSYSIVRNAEKCVLCRRCETMCNEVQTVGVYSTVHRGFDTVMGTAFDLPMLDTACTFCGQCVSVCPTAALTETDDSEEVWAAVSNPDIFVIAQTAPAIRVTLGEEFGMPVGTQVTGKMVAALKKMGFDMVLDTDFAADLTVVEEASEFMHRMEHGGRLPILTSCCPAWVKFIEHQFPELLDIPSTCKSPHEMFGAVAKSYLARKLGKDPAKIKVVSVMPCLAKKFEARREELTEEPAGADVDYVLSTRELARMIREAGINFGALRDESFDDVMGESTGAAVIFGTTGGVIEAAVRTAAAWLDPENPSPVIDFKQLRGIDGIREAEVAVAGKTLKIAIAHGLGNARKLLTAIRDGEASYDAIEIMACPMGCVGGGGQPYHGNNMEVLKARMEAIFKEDAEKPLRRSHENGQIKRLYEEFLGEPYGEKAHELLHTHYQKREQI
ncbi:MAG: NADH-dependent [FeFe] hydrogenase, group A6 [Firmicutes bacterium]|nr:NADH-dependent [FeFe] hydrogenase, group A6 [Bacillota bacterium]